MKEQFYGVQVVNFVLNSKGQRVDLGHEKYRGRDPKTGQVILSKYVGRLMNRDTAEKLVKLLRPQYPEAQVVELEWSEDNEPDGLAATSLKELGEIEPLERLSAAVKQCFASGNSREEVIEAVNQAVCS